MLLGSLAATRADTTLVSYSFDSLSAGALAGQDGWTLTNSAVSPIVSSNNSSTGFSDLTGVAGRAVETAGAALVKNSTLFSSGSLNSSSLLTLSMNVYAGGAGSTSFFGVGNSSYGGGANMSAAFGIFGGIFAVRGESNGTVANAMTSAGANKVATTGHWYTLQSVWDLSTGMAQLSFKDLTAGDTSFTSLYFDAAQTQLVVSLLNGTTALTPATWNTVYLREGTSAANSGVGFVDNLSATVVPEPATVALAGLALLLGAASLRRKPAFAR